MSNREIYHGLNNPGDTSSLYPYTSFKNAGSVVCEVKCDQPDTESCQYIQFLHQKGYTDLYISNIGRVRNIELKFWINWSSKNLNLPYPAMFCKACPWNRGR